MSRLDISLYISLIALNIPENTAGIIVRDYHSIISVASSIALVMFIYTFVYLELVLDVFSVGEDGSGGSSGGNGHSGGRLDQLTIGGDDSGGSDDGVGDRASGALLDVLTVGEDVAGGSFQNDRNSGFAELDELTIGEDDSRWSDDGGGSLLSELHVIAILGHDAGGSDQDDVAGEVVGELNVAGFLDDSRGADVRVNPLGNGDGRGSGSGTVEFGLTVGQLKVGSILGDDSRGSDQNDVAGEVMRELDVLATWIDDSRWSYLCVGNSQDTESYQKFHVVELVRSSKRTPC